MMELATAPCASIWTLSYNEETQESRDAARMFAYGDVRDWLKRVRRAMWRNYPGENTWLRFIVCGEQGDKNGRCHWHVILYSSHEVQSLGVFHGFKAGRRGKQELRWPEDRADMVTVERRKAKRLDWSLWGRGFVTLQDPGPEVVHYVVSYCIADQFTEEKARNTARHASSGNFVTGLFRMSKRPAIGERYLYNVLADLDQRGQVLPALKIKIPNVKGYYVPSGRMRQQTLWGLVAINDRVRYATGADAPQWRTLLHSLADNEADLEVLRGPQENPDDIETVETEFAKRGRDYADRRASAETRRKCGASIPCWQCLNGFSDEKLSQLGLVRSFAFTDGGDSYARYESVAGFASYADRRKARYGGQNPDCILAGSKANRRAFPATGCQAQ